MDAAGNAVSVTHTLGTGAGVVTPGLGFQWNNAMKLFDPQPGRANGGGMRYRVQAFGDSLHRRNAVVQQLARLRFG